jgi:hypothetical protein
MISSQGHDLNAQGDQRALANSLGLDDQSSGETRRFLDGPIDKEFASHLKVRVHLHDDKEIYSPPGVMAVEPPIDAEPRQAIPQGDPGSDENPAVGRRSLRTVAFGVITGVLVSAAIAWQFYGDDQGKHMVGAGKLHRAIVRTNSSSSNAVPAEQAAKISDRVLTQGTDVLQAAPANPSAQVSVVPGSSAELQHQLETMQSDVAMVRQIVERLAAVQERMALDIATLQKSVQKANQKASLPSHPPAVPVSARKHAPSIAHPDVAAVPSAPAKAP